MHNSKEFPNWLYYFTSPLIPALHEFQLAYICTTIWLSLYFMCNINIYDLYILNYSHSSIYITVCPIGLHLHFSEDWFWAHFNVLIRNTDMLFCQLSFQIFWPFPWVWLSSYYEGRRVFIYSWYKSVIYIFNIFFSVWRAFSP